MTYGENNRDVLVPAPSIGLMLASRDASQDGPSAPASRTPAGRGARTKRKPAHAFDQWLARGLHQMFDEVAREPIPEELLKLIEDDGKR